MPTSCSEVLYFTLMAAFQEGFYCITILDTSSGLSSWQINLTIMSRVVIWVMTVSSWCLVCPWWLYTIKIVDWIQVQLLACWHCLVSRIVEWDLCSSITLQAKWVCLSSEFSVKTTTEFSVKTTTIHLSMVVLFGGANLHPLLVVLLPSAPIHSLLVESERKNIWPDLLLFVLTEKRKYEQMLIVESLEGVKFFQVVSFLYM